MLSSYIKESMLYTVYFNGKSLSTILPKENFLDQETFLFTLQRNAHHGREMHTMEELSRNMLL